MPVHLTCRQCGKPFRTKPVHVASGRAKFCSRACESASRRNAVEKVCPRCGKTFISAPSRRQRFCNFACAFPVITRTCQRCGKVFRVPPLWVRLGRGKFCSRACRTTRGVALYLQVKHNGDLVKLHRLVWQQAHGPIPVGSIIHHINGDKRDNRLENLVCMTRGEHTLLHKLGGKRPRTDGG